MSEAFARNNSSTSPASGLRTSSSSASTSATATAVASPPSTPTAARPDFLSELADPGLAIGNIANLEARGEDAGFNPVGTGPFKFKEWVRGSEISLERNPDWTWGTPMFKLDGPSLIECITYRHSGHSRADPAKYRPEGELEKWKERDPIKIYRQRLLEFGIDPEVMKGIEDGIKREIDEATEKCKASPPPPMDIITTDVYADGGFAWRN